MARVDPIASRPYYRRSVSTTRSDDVHVWEEANFSRRALIGSILRAAADHFYSGDPNCEVLHMFQLSSFSLAE